MFQSAHYREILKELLKERMARNPQYSLRAMSVQAGVTPSMLSEVMSGRKNLSANMAAKVGRRLRLSESESEYFQLLVRFETAEEDLRRVLLPQIQSFWKLTGRVELDADAFRVISDWYHLPILELCAMARFELNERNVCKELGITSLEAALAIERLKRHGLLVQNTAGRWVKANSYLRYSSEKKSSAIRSFHRQMLERTLSALELHKPDDRYIGTETFLMSPQSLPLARARIDECFDDLLRLSTPEAPDAVVFHAGVQLFQVRASRPVSPPSFTDDSEPSENTEVSHA